MAELIPASILSMDFFDRLAKAGMVNHDIVWWWEGNNSGLQELANWWENSIKHISHPYWKGNIGKSYIQFTSIFPTAFLRY